MPRFRASFFRVLFCVGLTSAFLGCSSDHYESFYGSLADADKAGAITRGWVPYYLPESSRAIRELHELSPSTEWCTFEFSPRDSEGFRKTLSNLHALTPSAKRIPNPRASWWPAILTGNLDVEKIHRSGFELYVVERPETSVTTEISLYAIDWANGRAFFYSRREEATDSSGP